MATVLITGASRGIGFEFARQFKEQGDDVIAVVRKPSEQLQKLGVRIIADVDVTNADSVARLASELDTLHIDYLINNAGIFTNETLDNMNFEAIAKQIEVNTIAPLRVTHALLKNLNKGSKLAIISSRMGSIDDNSSGGYYGYRLSKAAANSLSKSLAIDLQGKGIAVAVLHPGFVRTDMTGGAGEINPDQAAKGMIKILSNLNVSNSGRFWHSNGSSLAW